MFYKKINLLILLAFITSCTITYEDPKSLEVKPQPVAKKSYGIWKKESCKLEATRADITIKLTDIYTEDKARILVQSEEPLKRKPEFKIWGLDGYDYEITGRGRTYSLEIPTTILAQAKMYLNQTFLQVRYQIKGTDYYRRAVFNLQEMPQAIIDIKNDCK
ncbi:MAG: hypothetical protein CFH44_00991 [Proteobacteria bacterium]|nr:MAG: hypothetical protein CFH44_00991 [Pseudomonadota bacterium]|tara:strand:+ start:1783 stop:2265 length:483 start_codon:yes stop_codon:yes gene_type:complete